MINPWLNLSTANNDFVATIDIDYLHHYQLRRSAQKDDFKLVTSVVPEPWCGPLLNARVLVLSGNPHWDDRDSGLPELAHPRMRENLSGREPIFWLDPSLIGTSGANWYRLKLLKNVLETCESRKVAERLSLVDFVGYRSHRWDHSLRPPSQAFTINAVREAIQRDAWIVVSRGRKLWIDVVPDLALYPRVLFNRSVQNVRLSLQNTGKVGFEAIVAELS